jgi:hypothetical protein
LSRSLRGGESFGARKLSTHEACMRERLGSTTRHTLVRLPDAGEFASVYCPTVFEAEIRLHVRRSFGRFSAVFWY